jgi:hypothetical protein
MLLLPLLAGHVAQRLAVADTGKKEEEERKAKRDFVSPHLNSLHAEF